MAKIKCGKCGQEFDNASALKKHFRENHHGHGERIPGTWFV